LTTHIRDLIPTIGTRQVFVQSFVVCVFVVSVCVMFAFRRSVVLLAQHGPYPTKVSTGLCGLEVVPNAKEVLQFLYEKMLKELQDGCK